MAEVRVVRGFRCVLLFFCFFQHAEELVGGGLVTLRRGGGAHVLIRFEHRGELGIAGGATGDLLAKGVIPWNDLPLWIPDTIPGLWGFHRTNCKKAIEAGLTIRPLQETITDLLEWIHTQPERLPLKAGPSEEQEARYLGL